MLKKTLQIIKNNPVIILCYVAYLAISILLLLFLYPKSFGVGTYTKNGAFDYSLYMVTMRNMLIALLLIFVFSLLFISGFSSMIREAVFSGKTKLYFFFDGIKNYFGRVLLTVLLTAAIIIIGSILFGLLSIPFTIMAVANGTDSVYLISLVIMLIALILFLIPSPFFILWLPALFLEDTGVIRSLRLGVKAGTKNYWKLLLVSFLLILPQAVYFILNYNVMMSGSLFSTGYFVMIGVMAVLSLFYNIYIFVLYHEYSSGLITIQRQQDANINTGLE